ncbi:four helix bundle protein [Bacteroides sp. 519]|uniref:four helix bundle protein n=1 Tax=Bacteroides sp. 519 TaxID=2302937 RepID=UPI0013D4C0B5|nr:four helix bundle protein [Bacteroides sp. 519]NDV59699.1 four helix bundle protein [Bacteroides sp. 519]
MGNIILDKSFLFALTIIKYTEELEKRRKFVLANQLLKSGTSVGANVREAQNCESRADFIHKLKIAAKEADETEYWLLLCKHSEDYPFEETLLTDIKELQKIINSIIKTAKKQSQ